MLVSQHPRQHAPVAPHIIGGWGAHWVSHRGWPTHMATNRQAMLSDPWNLFNLRCCMNSPLDIPPGDSAGGGQEPLCPATGAPHAPRAYLQHRSHTAAPETHIVTNPGASFLPIICHQPLEGAPVQGFGVLAFRVLATEARPPDDSPKLLGWAQQQLGREHTHQMPPNSVR